MKRIHIVGKKNSGKTTLIADLVRHYTKLGHRVGTIKHTHHRHELDTPGKDSYQHRESGAAVVGILSPGLTAAFWPPRSEDESRDPYDELERLFEACDFVLVEGHYQIAEPRIEVWQASVSEEPLASGDPTVLAVITDDPVHVSVPVWSRSDVPALANRIFELVMAE